MTDAWLVWLHTFITHIHRPKCRVGSTAQHCWRGSFQDSDFVGDFEDSKSTSDGVLCIFGSRTLVRIIWMCKKQTSLSHSSTESEVISVDAVLRMDGIPSPDLWDVVIETKHTSKNTHTPTHQAMRNHRRGKIRSTNPKTNLNRSRYLDVDELLNDHVVTKRKFFSIRSSVVHLWR